MKAKNKKVTLADIAKRCGVSKMTVSRVLRGDPDVSDSTRQIVLKEAERENYVPLRQPRQEISNGVSRSSYKQYHVLCQTDATLTDAFFGRLIRSIQRDLFENGHGCSFGVIENDYDSFLKMYNMLQTRDSNGFFVVGPVRSDNLNVLLERFPNVVLVDNPGSPELIRPYNAVSYDTAYGSAMATRHLLKLGRHRILLLHGPEDHYFAQGLLEGYKAALAQHDLQMDPELTMQCGFHIDDGYKAARNALSSRLKFDAVFANDENAWGAMQALKEAGLSVPDDVAVMGFDNQPISRTTSPALSTIAKDPEKMGATAVKLLLKLNNGDVTADPVMQKVIYFPTLIVRDSCGAKRGKNNGQEES